MSTCVYILGAAISSRRAEGLFPREPRVNSQDFFRHRVSRFISLTEDGGTLLSKLTRFVCTVLRERMEIQQSRLSRDSANLDGLGKSLGLRLRTKEHVAGGRNPRTENFQRI